MSRRLRRMLQHPLRRGLAADDPRMLDLHQRILDDKPLMQEVLMSFYEVSLECSRRHFRQDGLKIELGAGTSMFKGIEPEVITTDLRPSELLDRQMDAQKMDVEDASTACVYGVNMFHHLPDPNAFFGELQRVLKPGGGCVLIEPHSGPCSAWLHSRLHDDEHFDPDQRDWQTDVTGPMSGANQALASIVFDRDRRLFEDRYGELEIVEHATVRNYLRYLLSGGLNFRQLVPTRAVRLVRGVERLLSPVQTTLALHQIVAIRRC